MSCDVITGVLASVALFTALILAFRRALNYAARIPPTNLPPRSLGLGYPIVGNLPNVGRRVHVTLTDLARTGKGGGLCRLRLGSWPAIVVSGQAAIREAFVRHGRALASRPNYRSYSSYADGKSISFQPYAAPLRLHRRLMLRAIRNIVETGSAERIVIRQVIQLIEGWIHRRRQVFDPAKSITLAVAGGLYSMCYGRDAVLSENKAFEDVLLETNPGTEILAFGNPVDLIQWYLCTARTRTKYAEYVKRMTSLLRLNDELVTTRLCRRHHRRDDDDDIVGAMLDASRDLDPTSGLTPQHLLRTSIEVMSAGSDTSSATLLWLIHYAVKHPDAQEKVHAEIRREVGPERHVTYADRGHLPYAESVVLEVMRLRSIVPFALPHYSTEDVRMAGGCTIPQHSLVFMNLWSVGRDKDTWGEDVDDFRPERFLVARDGPGGALTVDATKTNMFYPFGLGRRRCVGEMLGRIQVFLFFVNIVQRFLLTSNEVLTDEEEFGDILKPAPFSIIVEDRRLL